MSANTANAMPQQVPAPARSRRANRNTWLITTTVAVAVPVLAWILTDMVGGHKLIAAAGNGTMRVDGTWIVVAAALGSSFGLGLKSILNRFAKNPRKAWLIVAPIALVLSLGGPLGGTTTLTVILLMAMHLVVGGTVIAGGLALSPKR